MSNGCGCKEVYRFPHNYYLSLYIPLVSALFAAAASLLFVHFKNIKTTLSYVLVDRSGSYSPFSAGVSGVFLVINSFTRPDALQFV